MTHIVAVGPIITVSVPQQWTLVRLSDGQNVFDERAVHPDELQHMNDATAAIYGGELRWETAVPADLPQPPGGTPEQDDNLIGMYTDQQVCTVVVSFVGRQECFSICRESATKVLSMAIREGRLETAENYADDPSARWYTFADHNNYVSLLTQPERTQIYKWFAAQRISLRQWIHGKYRQRNGRFVSMQ